MAIWMCERCENIYLIKLEADFAIDPIWCGECGLSIDIHEFQLSDSLKEDLISWGNDYGEWINFESDTLIENGIELEEKFNKNGFKLAKKVKDELGEKFKITFLPSLSAQSYKDKD